MTTKFTDQVLSYLRAGYAMLSVNTHEEMRVMEDFRSLSSNKIQLLVWDSLVGLVAETVVIDAETKQKTRSYKVIPETVEPMNMFKQLRALIAQSEDSEKLLIVLKDFHLQLERAGNRIQYIRHLRNLVPTLSSTGCMIVFVSPHLVLPPELERDVQVLNYKLPDDDRLWSALLDTCATVGVKPDTTLPVFEDAVKAAKGLTLLEAENAFALAIRASKKEINTTFVETVFEEKINQIKKNGSLTYLPPDTTFNDIGGLEVVKNWISTRKKGFTQKAKEYGLKAPKGVLLCGFPGTGKSFLAKATGAELGCPVFQLDMGSLFDSKVGGSERNLRNVLDILDSIGFCVLLIDEIEKSLNKDAVSGQGDSGTSSRLFATLLSWLNDKKTPVFVIATSNNHTVLPPELIRKGRFDEAFWLDLPTEQERAEIFNAVIRTFGRDPNNYKVKAFAKNTVDYTGAEIATMIDQAGFRAFSRESEMKDSDIVEVMADFKSYASVNAEHIKALREGAQNKLRAANKEQTSVLVDTERSLRVIEISNTED